MKLYKIVLLCLAYTSQINRSLIAFFKATLKKGFTFKQLKENDILTLVPKGAFQFGGTEGDKYIKLWVTADNMVGMVTWANTMIDDNFNWNAKSRKAAEKRDNNKLIGIERFTKAYLKSNDAIFK